jgi:hypothetical protein
VGDDRSNGPRFRLDFYGLGYDYVYESRPANRVIDLPSKARIIDNQPSDISSRSTNDELATKAYSAQDLADLRALNKR